MVVKIDMVELLEVESLLLVAFTAKDAVVLVPSLFIVDSSTLLFSSFVSLAFFTTCSSSLDTFFAFS